MLTPEEYAALMDILQRTAQGRLSNSEALALNVILSKLAPIPAPEGGLAPIVDPPSNQPNGDEKKNGETNPQHAGIVA